MAKDKRRPGVVGRRSVDIGHCATHEDCLGKIAANTKEICWMRKLMMGTLITGIFTLIAALGSLIVLILGHTLKGV